MQPPPAVPDVYGPAVPEPCGEAVMALM